MLLGGIFYAQPTSGVIAGQGGSLATARCKNEGRALLKIRSFES